MVRIVGAVPGRGFDVRHLRRALCTAAFLLVAVVGRAVAHPGHEQADAHDGNEFEVALLLFALGLGFVVAGVAADHHDGVGDAFGRGMVVGGGVLLVLATPLLWWFWGT